jgi:all-trans-8'-apo-beta-carotenal 15,15'-oxygenase
LIFFIPPLFLHKLGVLVKSFGESFEWRPQLGTDVLVVPIDDPKRSIRFSVAAFFQFHFVNAFERGREIVVDYVRYKDYSIDRWLRDFTRGEVTSRYESNLSRAVLDVEARTFDNRVLWDSPCEFPAIQSIDQTRPYRRVVLVAHSSETARLDYPDSLVRLDVETGASEVLKLGANQFVASPALTEADADGRSHILVLVYDAAAHRSFIAVIDDARFSEGPVARVHFDQHIPYNFHSLWQSGESA